MTETSNTFHAVDYVVFALSLVLCCGIGVVYGFVSMKKKKSAKEQLSGGKSMGIVPVSLSLLASFQAAPFVLGTPAEMYSFGTTYFLILVGLVVALPVVAHIIVPVLHRLDLLNGYQYFEMRFNKVTRIMASIIFCLMIIFYQAVTVYAPALAFSQVTGLSQDISILGVGIIATFYTTIGGLAAVIWIDVLQMLIILAGLIVMAALGASEVGGWNEVMDTSNDGGRINFNNFDPDPTARTTFWTTSLGGAFIVLSVLGSNQASIQKYLSIGNVKDAQKTPYFVGAFYAVYLFLICFLGLVMYTYYLGCDPIITGRVEQTDQLILLFLMDVVGDLRGIPGLFTSAVFCASLSTVSAGINALAAVTMIDFLLPLYRRYKKLHSEEMVTDEKTLLYLSKGLTIFYGLVTIGFAYLAPLLGDALLQMAFTIFGTLGGPLLGMMLLGMLFPFANVPGVISGLVASLTMSFWVCIGAIATDSIRGMARMHALPLSGVYDCPAPPMSNGTDVTVAMVTDLNETGGPAPTPFVHEAFWLYTISYMWYAFVGAVVVLIVGVPVSLATGGRKQYVDPKLLAFNFKFCQNKSRGVMNLDKVPEKQDNMAGNFYSSNPDMKTFGQDNLAFVTVGEESNHSSADAKTSGHDNPAYETVGEESNHSTANVKTFHHSKPTYATAGDDSTGV